VFPIVAAQRAGLVASDHVPGNHVRLVTTPGHTVGHCSVELDRKRANAFITGDVVHLPSQA